MVRGDPYTEGSQTAKSGTDEQKRHMRLSIEDKQAHLCNVHFISHFIVDAAAIGGRKLLLPGEVPPKGGKSADAIVVVGKRAITDKWRPHRYNEGPNVKLFQMLQGGTLPALH